MPHYFSLIRFPLREHLQHALHRVDGRDAALTAAGLVLAVATTLYVVRKRRPTEEELERRRRERLAAMGRITDGHIVDARTLAGEESVSATPEVLFYSYRLAGVTYNCAQDVSRLPEKVRGWRLDQPVQVRYDPRNPGNSLLLSESWSGLWQASDTNLS